ncbi:MAG: protein kinase [Proteobacteria bacterium]|nr:protein kinase [Pseudomonadota bacterium]
MRTLGQTPSIIHRDLSSNNVLLTPNMTAKISDLGVARMLNLTPLQVSRMTGTPGTPAYMRPEAMVANPKYDASIDIFSFGALLIHVLSGKWPEPQIGPNQIDPETERLVPVSEAERRKTLLDSIGYDHQLMELILKCIDNNPKHRPPSSNVVESLKEMKFAFSTPFANQLEMLARIEADKEEKRTLISDQKKEFEAMKQKEKQMAIFEEEMQRNDIQKSEKFSQVKLALSAEVEQQRLLIEDLVSQIQGLEAEKQSISQSARSAQNEKEVLAAQVTRYNKEMNASLKSFEEKHHQERKKQQEVFAEEKQRIEHALEEERDLHQKASAQNLALQAEVHILKGSEERFKSSLAAKDDVIACKNSELEIKAGILQQKDVTISGMSEQLTAARRFLATTQQV